MRRIALLLLVTALASPAAASPHDEWGWRLFPLSLQRQRAEQIAEVQVRLAHCLSLKPGPAFKRILWDGLIDSFNPPPATQPDLPRIRGWIAEERARLEREWSASPTRYQFREACEWLREKWGSPRVVVEQDGQKAVSKCSKEGTCGDRIFIELY